MATLQDYRTKLAEGGYETLRPRTTHDDVRDLQARTA